jgi:hypothetical protein
MKFFMSVCFLALAGTNLPAQNLDVPGIDEAKFQEQAEQTKKNCPVSVALSGTEINLKATLTGR